VLSTRPSRLQLLRRDTAAHTAQDKDHDDGIVGIPEDGNEVRDDLDRNGQIDKQQATRTRTPVGSARSVVRRFRAGGEDQEAAAAPPEARGLWDDG
jgi:hypothetical protein